MSRPLATSASESPQLCCDELRESAPKSLLESAIAQGETRATMFINSLALVAKGRDALNKAYHSVDVDEDDEDDDELGWGS